MDINQIKDKIKNHKPGFVGYKYEYAVLLPLVFADDEWQILYEIRSHKITQPGEVSFPGGRVESNEKPLQAALRETEEEIGHPIQHIEVLGEIDRIANGRVIVHCYVGILNHFDLKNLKVNEDEVADIFLKPVDYFIQQPAKSFTYQTERRLNDDFPIHKFRNIDAMRYKKSRRNHQIPYYPTQEEVIWGLTAELTEHFIQIIQAKS